MKRSLSQGRRLRVLHLIASNFVGGPEKQILRHARQVASHGWELWIGSFRDMPSEPEILQAARDLGIPTLELSSGHFLPGTTLQLARWLRGNKISILCTHGYKANVVGWLAKHLVGVPQICVVRGWTAETWPVKQYERLDRLVLSRAPWVVTVSQALADQLRSMRKCLNPPIVIQNAALVSNQNMTLPADRLPVRRLLGLSLDAFWVCTVGRLSEEKGHRFLVDALPSMDGRIPGLRVLFVGEGRERERLGAQLARLGMQDRAMFAGFQKDVRPWIQACDVLVNPSLTEGLPNVVLEAMALGTPVVATAVGGVPEVVRDRESGLLVAPSDPSGLSRAVCSLWADHAFSLHLAKCAQARIQDYSPEKQCRLLLDLYAQVLQLPPAQFGATETLAKVEGVPDPQIAARVVN